MRFLISIIILVFSLSVMNGQENSISIDRIELYKQGRSFFESSLYGPAGFSQEKFMHQVHPATEDDFTNLQDDAAAMKAISSLRLDLTSGENELITFITEKYPDPSTTPAILELGSYYYNKKWFKKSIDMYNMADLENLPEFDMSEASFKKGYAHFVLKEFKEGKSVLARIKDIQNIYYYPSNYYYGLCDYFTGNFTGAISSFEKVKNNDGYKSFVPYYITQIYFAQNNSDKVIVYGEASLKDGNLRNRKEIRQLIGQSYFKIKAYEKALPHLEFYEANTEKLTIEEFFQLGFTQYQLKYYKAAIKSLVELNLLDSKLGQLVNYYLADCYYRTGDLVSARAAFKKVSQMSFEKSMQEEATFNYGKLSAQSGFEREAINTLIKIEKKSTYYKDANKIIHDLLTNMSDYPAAIQIMENLPSIADELKITYQSVCLKYGMQQYNVGQTEDALKNLSKALKYNLSNIIAAQSKFWTAQIQNEKSEYTKSIKTFDEYFDISNGLEGLPDESSPLVGHYTQGYNYLMLKDFRNAEKSFKNALVGLNINSVRIKNKDLTDKIWPDALLRTGDCLFKANKYKDALGFYDEVIRKKQGGFVYAMYQKGMIEGLMGEPYEKILTLRDVKTQYPNSEFADDALMQLGDTYFELENVDNAYASFTELTSKYKNSPLKNAAYLKLGLIAYNKGDMKAAISHYKAIFQNNPSSKEAESALLGLQEIYINDLGQSDEYVAFLSSIPGYKITDSAADSLAYMVGALRYNEGEYEKAVSGFNNYLDKYPNGGSKVKAIYYRAESYSLLKKYGPALDDYEKLAKMGNSEFYVQSVKKAALISYNYTQTFDKAYMYYDLYFSNITDDDEKFKAALGALRSAFRISNDEGVKKYGTIVGNHKKADEEEKAVAFYYLGKIYYRDNDLENAKSSFTKAAEKVNNNQAAESRYLMAEIFYKQANPTKAEDQCNDANDKNTSYPYWIAKSLLLMSDIYVDRKDLFNARAALEAVIENFPDDADLQTAAKDKLKKVETLEQQKNRIKSPNTTQLEFQNSGGK